MDEKTELLGVWERARARFDADDTLRPQQKAWLNLTRPMGLVEDTALIAAPNEFVREYLDSKLRPYLALVLGEEIGRDVQIAVTVQSADEAAADEPVEEEDDSSDDVFAEEEPGDDWLLRRPAQASAAARHALSDRDARLNPKYTFDTFVIGSSNRFTHAAAVAVAEAPAKAYNPLFIYGESGLSFGESGVLRNAPMRAARLFTEPQIVIENPTDWYLVQARATRDRDSICVQQPRSYEVDSPRGSARLASARDRVLSGGHLMVFGSTSPWVKLRQDGRLERLTLFTWLRFRGHWHFRYMWTYTAQLLFNFPKRERWHAVRAALTESMVV